MDTTITLTIGQLLTWVLIIVGIIAVIYLIVLLARIVKLTAPLTDTVTKTNKILDDVSVITQNAADGTTDAKEAVHAASAALKDLSKMMDSNKGTISAVTNLVNASSSIASIAKGGKKSRRK
ncbi:MAG: hypothetical protein MJ150_06450 [Clostridia bacterium]|nr:hypothetical protein [Clostridia bacterium]